MISHFIHSFVCLSHSISSSSFSFQNEDLASLAAQQYYIEFGGDITTERVGSLLSQYIPDSCLAGMGMKERWIGMIVKAFKEVHTHTNYCTCTV